MADPGLPVPPAGADVTSQPNSTVQNIVQALASLGHHVATDTWPGRLATGLAESAVQGFKAPHDALYSTPENPVTTEELIKPALDMSVLTGTGAAAAPEDMRGDLGVFLGSKGVKALQQQTGKMLPEHPAAVANLRYGAPMIGDQALREQWAQGILNMRRQAAQPDTGVFEQSGWSLGADNMPRREVPDIGAKLEPVFEHDDGWGSVFDQPMQQQTEDGGLRFRWNHPAGDLHSVYNVPSVVVKGRGTGGGASFNSNTGQITINADPYTKAGMDYANMVVPHEFQHAIQQHEGFDVGGNPVQSPLYKEFWDSFGTDPVGRMQKPKGIVDAMRRESEGAQLGFGYSPQALDTYRRLQGETEARNVTTRRGNSYNYLLHPSLTEDIPRDRQLLSYTGTSWPHQIHHLEPSTGTDVSSMVNALLRPQR